MRTDSFPGRYKNKTFPKEEITMKKSLVLAMAMALGVTASAYAANPSPMYLQVIGHMIP